MTPSQKRKNKHLLEKYGVTLERYDTLLENQDGKCAICRISRGERAYAFSVDHDHDTEEVRGLLCTNCNLGLGLFKDSSELLVLAAKYLHRFNR